MPATANDLARYHEYTVAGIMPSLSVLRRRRHNRLHDFEDEEVVFIDHVVVNQPALEIGVALAYKRGFYLLRLLCRQLESLELVD